MKPITKFFTCCIIVLLTCTLVRAQTPYNDAVSLKKLLAADGKWPRSAKDEVVNILSNYCPKSVVEGAFFDGNDFIGPYAANLTARNSVSGGQNIFSAIGGFDVTNMANGLALFLIDRAKNEINVAFFVRLEEFLNKYPEVAVLFPNTKTFLTNFKSWEYANYLNTLKEAFNKDIKLLPADLLKLQDIDCTGTTGDDNTACATRIAVIKNFLASKQGILLLSASKIGEGFIQGQKIPEIIDPVISTKYLLNPTVGLSPNAQNGLELLNIVNKSLQSNETGKSYITTAQFDLLKTDPILLDLFLGLVWQQMQLKDIKFTSGATPVVVTTSIFTKTKTDGITNYITNVFNQTKNVQVTFDNLKKDQLDGKTNLAPDYAALITSVQQTIQALRTTVIIDPRLAIPADADVVFEKTDAIFELSGQIFNSNYSAAVMGMLGLMNDAIKKYDPKSAHEELVFFTQSFLKYGSFAANFVEAKTPEESKAAIEAVALPVGSYTIKRKSKWNISVNGYAGYTFDVNYANGVYAPVGFAFSHGTRQKRGWGFTIFTGLIDVGSLVSYNLQASNTETQKQEIRLESIFSPSAQFLLGIGNTPIAVGAGYRRTPKLFYSKADGTFNPIAPKDVLSVSILIDIPLFTLHNSPFK